MSDDKTPKLNPTTQLVGVLILGLLGGGTVGGVTFGGDMSDEQISKVVEKTMEHHEELEALKHTQLMTRLDNMCDEIKELQRVDRDFAYQEQRRFMGRCEDEEARRIEAGLCPSCGQKRPPEDENDFTTRFLASSFL